MSDPSAPPPADLPEPPPTDLRQPSRTSSVHVFPPSRTSMHGIGLDLGLHADADGLGLRATDLGLHATDGIGLHADADGLGLRATDLGLHATDGIGLHADADGLGLRATDLGLHATDGIGLHADADGLGLRATDEIPKSRLLPHLSFEDSFLGDQDEAISSKERFQFTAIEDVIAMGIPVGGRDTFLHETNRFQVNTEADKGASDADQAPASAQKKGHGRKVGGYDIGGKSLQDSDADQAPASSQKKGHGRKVGGYDIGSESLQFKSGPFRSKKSDKYSAGGRSHRTPKPDQEGKCKMRLARALVAETLHLDAEAYAETTYVEEP